MLSSRTFVQLVKRYVHGTHVNIVVVLVLYSTFAEFFLFRCGGSVTTWGRNSSKVVL